MAPDQNQYHFSFFKPTNNSARRNRNIIIQFVLIWAVAIFGFQILLKVLEKPTPEPEYILFQTSWEAVLAGNPSQTDLQVTARAALSVLGKGLIQPRHRLALDNALSWLAYELADSAQKELLLKAVTSFEDAAANTTNITDPGYLAQKNELTPILAGLFDLETTDVRVKIAPLEVKSSGMGTFHSENRELFEEAMGFYMVHNRSVLTDTTFLGFPFHYFYTAVFLLVLFVGLCWLYCVRTDMFNKKYGIEE